MMPNSPSYLPALRTLSWCEPVITIGAPRILCRIAADDVAERIEIGGHPRITHQADQILARGFVLAGSSRCA